MSESSVPSYIRAELNLQTIHSPHESVIRTAEAICFAAEQKFSALAITDRAGAYAFYEAEACCDQLCAPPKLIYGALLDCAETVDAQPFGVTLLARTREGLCNLYRIVSDSYLPTHSGGTYPCTALSFLLAHRGGLLLGRADDGRPGGIDADFDYFELLPPTDRAGEAHAAAIVERGRAAGIPVLAVSGARYLGEKEQTGCSALRACADEPAIRNSAARPLLSAEELLLRFAFLGSDTARRIVLENPARLAARAEPFRLPRPDGPHAPILPHALWELRRRCMAAARAKYGDSLPAWVAVRLEHELDDISCTGNAVPVLLAAGIADFVRERGGDCIAHSLPAAPGGFGGMLTASLLGLTAEDPLSPWDATPSSRSRMRLRVAVVVPEPLHHQVCDYLKTIFGEKRVFCLADEWPLHAKIAAALAGELPAGQSGTPEAEQKAVAETLCGAIQRQTRRVGLLILPPDVDVDCFSPRVCTDRWRAQNDPFPLLQNDVLLGCAAQLDVLL